MKTGPDPTPAIARVRARFFEEDRGYSTPCHIWPGAKSEKGYGLIVVVVSPGKYRRARVHRVVFESLVGPIPDDKQIDHLCRVRECCNLEHLELVTSQENTRRGRLGEVTRARNLARAAA